MTTSGIYPKLELSFAFARAYPDGPNNLKGQFQRTLETRGIDAQYANGRESIQGIPKSPTKL